MKKMLIAGLAIVVFGCTKPSGYKIEVSLDGATGKMFIEKRDGGKFVAIDTAEVVNGVSVFEGKVDFPDQVYLSLEGKNQRGVFFIENVAMNVTGHIDSLRKIKVTGSPLNDEYFAIRAKMDEVSERGRAKYREYESAVQSGDTAKASGLMKEVELVFSEQDTIIMQFIRNNPGSWITPVFLSQVQYSKDMEELESMVNSLDPKLAVVPSIIRIKEHIEAMKKVAVGQIAPDFTQNDPKGNPVRLSDVYSKNAFTLIDFWASWCGPCRQENPNVVAAFNTYKGKGFGIIGVSLDQDSARWIKAIADDKLDWTQVSDLKYWQNEAASLYAVNSIPSNFLVDKTGKIIARNLREKALHEKLAELLP